MIVKLTITTDDLNQVLNGAIYHSAGAMIEDALHLRRTQGQQLALASGRYHYQFTASRDGEFTIESDQEIESKRENRSPNRVHTLHHRERESFNIQAGQILRFDFEVKP